MEEALVLGPTAASRPRAPLGAPAAREAAPSPALVLSFDVEEHYRIESAAGLAVAPEWQAHYRGRVDVSTRWLLDLLGEAGVRATFFILGEIARDNPGLVRAVARGGHEVASHGWDHRRVHRFTPEGFREDVRRSKETLEDVAGVPVLGYRAPTFSVMPQTAWALDVLAEEGFAYDSSIFPVRHDRYGVPAAPRTPFLARGERRRLLELPPATLRLLGMNWPMGGGGYFRLFPLWCTRWAIRQLSQVGRRALGEGGAVMLYFHPWEFDAQQRRLPLGGLSRLRTYVGIGRTAGRLRSLLAGCACVRALDLLPKLTADLSALPQFALAGAGAEELPAAVEGVVNPGLQC